MLHRKVNSLNIWEFFFVQLVIYVIIAIILRYMFAPEPSLIPKAP